MSEKYRLLPKKRIPKTEDEKSDEEIRLTNTTQGLASYVARAATVYNELNKTKVVLTATGNALTKAVSVAEIIKRRFKGLHQITKLEGQEITDEYEPLEEGLEMVYDTRVIPFISITLSKEPLDTADKGYQPPIDESLVSEKAMEELLNPRPKGGGRGGGRGKGKEDGKGKGKGKEGTGKGKGKDDKGKGKGKGKEADSGKGKGKGKGKDDSKGKGKGKGKSSWDAPKSKGKGSWDSYGGGGGGKSYGGGGYGRSDDWGSGYGRSGYGGNDSGYGRSNYGSSKGSGYGGGYGSSYNSWDRSGGKGKGGWGY